LIESKGILLEGIMNNSHSMNNKSVSLIALIKSKEILLQVIMNNSHNVNNKIRYKI